MSDLRDLIRACERADDIVPIDEPLHWDGEAAAVAAEALRRNGPALRFEDTPGIATVVSGIAAGPDQLTRRGHRPWARIGRALDTEDFVDLLDRTSTSPGSDVSAAVSVETDELGPDLYELGLPTRIEPGGRPRIDLGICCVGTGDEVNWLPTRGVVSGGETLHLAVPRGTTGPEGPVRAGESVAVALGVSPAVNLASTMRWVHRLGNATTTARAAALGGVGRRPDGPVSVPAGTEIAIHGTVGEIQDEPGGPAARWELATEVAGLSVTVDRIVIRPDPLVPFVPRSRAGPIPMADDTFLASLGTAATLHRRLNDYWGVAPVHWVHLPVEAELGICLASVDVLYAGFQWQLANTLFSFSPLFDKVVLLDEDNDPADLAGGLDDMWVRAHPAGDWYFSEPDAPRAVAPAYHDAARTGARVYIDATWDPNWDEEYIAPRVTFETAYPAAVREKARDVWSAVRE